MSGTAADSYSATVSARVPLIGALAARLPVSRTTGRQLKASFVLFCLAPIMVLLGTRLSHLVDDPVFGIYAVVMLAVMTTVMWFAFAVYRDPSLDPPVTDELLFVSCLVAVKNELQVVERCVGSMLASSYEPKEVIVVDDGSDDGTAELLEGLARRHPEIRLIRMTQSVGKKRALTAGAAEARGDLLVFTDSD